MAEFSLQDLWWLKPKEQDNPLPALQLGVQIAQNKAQMDLRERDLANDIARTSLMREEMLAKQKIQTMLVAGNAEMASAIAGVSDWTDEEQVSRVWETGSRNPMTVGGKAWLGAQHMYESARTAKRMQEEADSRNAFREDRAEYNATRLELQALLADNTIDLTDERILKLQKETAMMDREMAVREGNLRLRGVELDQKGKRLSLRDTVAYKNELKALENEEKDATATVGDSEKLRLRKLYNLKRRSITEKFYGPQEQASPEVTPRIPRAGLQTNSPAGSAPQPVSPSSKVRVIAPDGRPGLIPESQLEDALKAGYTRP